MKKLRYIRDHNYGWVQLAIERNGVAFEEGEGLIPLEKVLRPQYERSQWMLVIDYDFGEYGDEVKIYIPIKTNSGGK